MNKRDIEKAWQRVCMWIGCTPKENTDAHEVYQIIKKTLEQQLTNGWMPVSERLPKEGRYLVTTVYGEVKESEFDLKKWWQIDNSTISLEWEEEPIKVVAWQPLPEPYKELATDNNVLTIGDKMRESNGSLAYMLGRLCSRGATDIQTFEMRGWTAKKWLDYLNQPYME